jgi:hypothetical protein
MNEQECKKLGGKYFEHTYEWDASDDPSNPKKIPRTTEKSCTVTLEPTNYFDGLPTTGNRDAKITTLSKEGKITTKIRLEVDSVHELEYEGRDAEKLIKLLNLSNLSKT